MQNQTQTSGQRPPKRNRSPQEGFRSNGNSGQKKKSGQAPRTAQSGQAGSTKRPRKYPPRQRQDKAETVSESAVATTAKGQKRGTGSDQPAQAERHALRQESMRRQRKHRSQRPVKAVYAEETFEDLQHDNERLLKEIILEIADIRTISLD